MLLGDSSPHTHVLVVHAVAVNFGMVSNEWLLQFDAQYQAFEAQRRQRLQREGSDANTMPRPPIEEADEEATSQAATHSRVQVHHGGSGAPAIESRKPYARVLSSTLSRRKIHAAATAVLDADGDGKVTLSESLNVPSILQRAKRPLLRCLASMRHLDSYMRFLFPLAYIPFVLYEMSTVNFFMDTTLQRALEYC